MSTGAVVPRPASEVTGSGYFCRCTHLSLDVTSDENQLMWILISLLALRDSG
jgi:hypothetical protein